MPLPDRELLRHRWERLCRGLSLEDPAGAGFDRLFAAYTAPDRHYHDIRHIADCLRELDDHRHLAADPDLIELAIWFHDVIYDGTRTDNEERSAGEARSALLRMRASAPVAERVHQLILCTRHDRDPETRDCRLLVDIDLASLALPPSRFDENSRLIRLEFAHLKDDDFLRGRSQMLRRLLDRPSLYYTEPFRTRCEAAARANLARIVLAD